MKLTPADDGRGDGVDERVKLGGEAQDDGVDGRKADNAGVVDLGEGEHAGVLTIGGVGGAAEEAGERGGETVADERAVQARVFDEVAAGGGGDGGDVADVLHHGGDGDRGHDQDGGDVELRDDELLKADEIRLVDSGEVDERLHHALCIGQLRAQALAMTATM